jgi:predicted anti-sigma-YlaC factor YlaD
VTAHTQVTELMSLLLDGEATPGQEETLRTHLRECPDCGALWAAWQALDAGFKAEPMVAPPPGLALRVAVRIDERSRWRSWTHWLGASLLIAWLSIAALGLLFTISALYWGLTHPLQAGMVLSAGAHVLSGVIWPMRSVEMVFASVGLTLWAGIVGYLVLTGMLLWLWLWLASRRAAFAPARSQ